MLHYDVEETISRALAIMQNQQSKRCQGIKQMLDGPKVITPRIEENDHKSGKEYSRVTMVMGIGVLQGVVSWETESKTLLKKGNGS